MLLFIEPWGGYLDGDKYKMTITLEEKAQLTLTTQSSTIIYKTPHQQAYQESTFYLKEDSYLEYLPDALIAYKDANYYQENTIYMKKGATLIYSDIITPGWSPEGDYFTYEMLRLKTSVYMEDELILYDHIKLQPKTQNMSGMGFMEGYTHLASLIIVGEKTNNELLDRLYETIQQESGDFVFGLSKLAAQGFTVRIMANYTQVIERIINACHEVISDEWYQRKPSFLRKY